MSALLPTIAAAILAILIYAPSAEGGAAREIRPYVTITGASSRIEERGCVVVTSTEHWLRLWFRHKGEDADQARPGLTMNASGVPQIDFQNCMVVAIFQGKTINSAGLKIASVTVEKDKVVLRYDDEGYQTAGPFPDGGAVPCSAYGFFVLPRHEQTLVVEENICDRIGGAPVWKERIRTNALHQWLLAIRTDQFRDKHPSPQVISEVIAALKRLLSEKKDSQAITRRLACDVLGRSASKKAVPVLLKALEDPHEKVVLTDVPGVGGAHMEWFAVWRDADNALRQITRASPIGKPGQREPIKGQREKIREAWLEWHKKNAEPTDAGDGK